VLQSWDRLNGLVGGASHVDGEMVAYTVGEILTPDTMSSTSSSARPASRASTWPSTKVYGPTRPGLPYVNREQDLGEVGLRKASCPTTRRTS
jgi:hypothetical protein